MVEELREPRYNVREIVLDRRKKPVEFDFPADFVAFIDISEIDPDKVFVAFNDPSIFIPISRVVIARISAPVLKRIFIDFTEDQRGKKIKLYYAGGPGIHIAANLVTIAGDYLGLAREATLEKLVNALESVGKDVLLVYDSRLVARVSPKLRASLMNVAVTANSDILSTAISPEYSPSTFRIYVSFDSSGVLSLVRTKGSTTVVEQLNAGNALNANSAYAFDVLVEGDEQINLRYSVNATLLRLIIVEIPGAIS